MTNAQIVSRAFASQPRYASSDNCSLKCLNLAPLEKPDFEDQDGQDVQDDHRCNSNKQEITELGLWIELLPIQAEQPIQQNGRQEQQHFAYAKVGLWLWCEFVSRGCLSTQQ